MRAVLQRVSQAGVAVEGAEIGSVGKGFLVLLAVGEGDTSEDGAWLAQKIASLRVFADEAGHMNLSARDAGGGALVISQFTLYASTRKGARPSFHGAARPETAIPLYEDFVRRLEEALGRPVAIGRFGAMMAVSLVNDGPVTILLDSRLRE